MTRRFLINDKFSHVCLVVKQKQDSAKLKYKAGKRDICHKEFFEFSDCRSVR